ncbi:MAG: OmpA/MotB family protein [Desulfohalobiaceae bacterium]
MAKKKSSKKGTPAWLITFSDLMTLMLTFFVLLVSMSALLDEEKRKIALGSVTGTFGMGQQSSNLLTTRPQDRPRAIEPGPMQEVGDLAPLKGLVWEDIGKDVDFMSNAFVQVLNINSKVLFAPGATTLTDEGRNLLDRILPALLEVGFPLLLAGHTSSLRDEMGFEYRSATPRDALNPSWALSLSRTQAVYTYLIQGGMDPKMLRMEAHGRFEPRYTNASPEGRSKNRRVELILDKRNYARQPYLRSLFPLGKDRDGPLMYRDFIFDIERDRAPRRQ